MTCSPDLILKLLPEFQIAENLRWISGISIQLADLGISPQDRMPSRALGSNQSKPSPQILRHDNSSEIDLANPQNKQGGERDEIPIALGMEGLKG